MKNILYHALCLSLIATTAQAKCGEKTGDVLKENCWPCGSNCTARLSNGVMTISGEGKMNNYYPGNGPWFAKIDQIESIQMADTITTVGSNAFKGATNLTDVHISTSASTIGLGAFRDTTSLTIVNIPASVETLEGTTFYNSGITSVNFAENSKLQKIGNQTFAGSQISQIALPEGLTSVDSYLFDSCKQLTDVKLPDSLENIGFRMFNGASSLEEIKLPANLKKNGRSSLYRNKY